MNRFLLIIVSFFIIYSLNGQNQFELPSHILVKNSNGKTTIIDNNKIDINLSRQGIKQRIVGWVNNQDLLLMIENSKDNNYSNLYSHLYFIDYYKNIVDTIYIANVSEFEFI